MQGSVAPVLALLAGLALSLQGCGESAPAPTVAHDNGVNAEPTIGPPTNVKGAGAKCVCKGAWNVGSNPPPGNCGNIWHHCPSKSCSDNGRTWCKVTDPSCATAHDSSIIGIDGSWAYCDPADNPAAETDGAGHFTGHFHGETTQEWDAQIPAIAV